MPAVDENQTGLQFVRDFYRGSSAYADHIDSSLLSNIHLVTRLDQAILNAVMDGKDIVLTGNPGDGKTHIIRMLRDKLEALGKSVLIELDASTLSNEEIYKHWKNARDNNVPYVIAINAAVLYSLYQYCKDFEPVKKAYEQMSHAVVFHNENEKATDIVVYDLSKREVLTKEILSQAIIKLTDDKHYEECKKCPLNSSCEVHRNCKLLKDEMFQSRLFIILQRVALQGYHATLRELQSFISYLIFGNRTCKVITKTTGNKEYNLVNLIYSGKGGLFKAIQNAIDPVNISHPTWDEKLLSNDIAPDTWVKDYEVPAEAIAYDNDELFQLRKRQFFFFNANGDALLEILDDEVKHFQELIEQDDSKTIKELILKLNKFFGAEKPSNSELQIWSGHRYDNEPRKVLISVGSIKKSGLKIGHPTLSKAMQTGIEMTSNYVRLEKKNAPNIFLKIDFDMYMLLTEADRGVPVLFMESDLVKKVWRFIEQLQSVSEIDEDDPVNISLLDVQNKKKIVVKLDQEENKYSSIDGSRSQEASYV